CVAVAWSVDPDREGGAIDLEWRESNGPQVFPPERRGFGLRLIERGATRELGGSARLDFSPQGVACAFRFPLSQKVMLP
ncbi:MAG: histidine kinase, partial [Hansschlegelia sp.]